MKKAGNEKYKDNIFRYLFSEEDNFVQLYYDLTDQKLDPKELEFYDTESIVVKQLKNDVAFKTKDNRLIIMVEHQSTLNGNMSLRFLLYYVELIKLYITQNDLNIFSKRALNIPAPEFYVVYNGTDVLESEEMYLKSNLNGAQEYIQVKVKAVNINFDQLPEAILKRHDVLDGYSYLMDRVRFYSRHERLVLEEAIERAITDTKQKGYLEAYLGRKEFITMITKVLTIEEEMDLIRRDERAEGMEKGMEKGKLEDALNMLSDGLPIEKVSKYTGLSIEKITTLIH